jgi:hypothetical protein
VLESDNARALRVTAGYVMRSTKTAPNRPELSQAVQVKPWAPCIQIASIASCTCSSETAKLVLAGPMSLDEAMAEGQKAAHRH